MLCSQLIVDTSFALCALPIVEDAVLEAQNVGFVDMIRLTNSISQLLGILLGSFLLVNHAEGFIVSSNSSEPRRCLFDHEIPLQTLVCVSNRWTRDAF